jgi:maltooligosyltrehalose trehalohydrolase
MNRRYPIGAEVTPEGVHFRVWAPKRRRVEVVIEPAPTRTTTPTPPPNSQSRDRKGAVAPIHITLQPEANGYFSALVPQAQAGSCYRFLLDGAGPFPDPASRFQPDGPHRPSQVIDPSIFSWGDAAWPGVPLEGQIIYEMHIGTFTREGTWQAARRELPELARLGITVLEVMPVACFPGRFGWGYDGVLWFSPVALYGTPDDFRGFVDDAHRLGIGVILDAVYNHVGPDGNYLKEFSDDYFTTRYSNEWGEAINFDGENSAPVREYVAMNAAYWAREFH